MFTFEIDSEIALVDCTLERWKAGVFSGPTSEDLKSITNLVAAIRHWRHLKKSLIQFRNASLAASRAPARKPQAFQVFQVL